LWRCSAFASPVAAPSFARYPGFFPRCRYFAAVTIEAMNTPADPQLEYLRVPPHSIEAEQSVLGGLLLDNTAWDRIADVLVEEDFYRHDHRLIWHHIARLIGLARPADVITVNESLISAGKAEETGGLAYLNALAHNTPSAANLWRYAEIVRQRAVTRKPVSLADERS